MSLFKTNTNYYSLKDEKCVVCSKTTNVYDHFLFAEDKNSPICTNCYIKRKGNIKYVPISSNGLLALEIFFLFVALLFFIPFMFIILSTIIKPYLNQNITDDDAIRSALVIGILGVFFYLGIKLIRNNHIANLPKRGIDWKDRLNNTGSTHFSSGVCFYDSNKPTNRCAYCEQLICQEHSYIYKPRLGAPYIVDGKEDRSPIHHVYTDKAVKKYSMNPIADIDNSKRGYIACKNCYLKMDLVDMEYYTSWTKIDKFYFGMLGLLLFSYTLDIILHTDIILTKIPAIFVILFYFYFIKRFFAYKRKLKKYIERRKINQFYCDKCGNNLAFDGEPCHICKKINQEQITPTNSTNSFSSW